MVDRELGRNGGMGFMRWYGKEECGPQYLLSQLQASYPPSCPLDVHIFSILPVPLPPRKYLVPTRAELRRWNLRTPSPKPLRSHVSTTGERTSGFLNHAVCQQDRAGPPPPWDSWIALVTQDSTYAYPPGAGRAGPRSTAIRCGRGGIWVGRSGWRLSSGVQPFSEEACEGLATSLSLTVDFLDVLLCTAHPDSE